MKSFDEWKKEKQRHDEDSSKFLLVFMVVLIVVAMLSSCGTQGYGCKGRESWNHLVKRINNGYKP